MSNLTLRFGMNPETGEPRLQAEPDCLNEVELLELNQELRPLYDQLAIAGRGSLVLQTPLQAVPTPARFQVRVLPGATERCPILELAHDPEEAPAVRENSSRGWPTGFLKELKNLLVPHGPVAQGDAEGVCLLFVEEELEKLGRQHHRAFAALLLAGYLTLMERVCHAYDPKRTGIYTLAGRAVEMFFGCLVAGSTPTRDATAGPPAAVTLPATARYLGRLLSLGKKVQCLQDP